MNTEENVSNTRNDLVYLNKVLVATENDIRVRSHYEGGKIAATWVNDKDLLEGGLELTDNVISVELTAKNSTVEMIGEWKKIPNGHMTICKKRFRLEDLHFAQDTALKTVDKFNHFVRIPLVGGEDPVTLVVRCSDIDEHKLWKGLFKRGEKIAYTPISNIMDNASKGLSEYTGEKKQPRTPKVKLVVDRKDGSEVVIEEGFEIVGHPDFEGGEFTKKDVINFTSNAVKVWSGSNEQTVHEPDSKAEAEKKLTALLGRRHGYVPKDGALTTIKVEYFDKGRLETLVGSHQDQEDASDVVRKRHGKLRLKASELYKRSDDCRVKLVTNAVVTLGPDELIKHKQLHIEELGVVYTGSQVSEITTQPGHNYEVGGLSVNYRYYKSPGSAKSLYLPNGNKVLRIDTCGDADKDEEAYIIITEGEEKPVTIHKNAFNKEGFHTSEGDAKGATAAKIRKEEQEERQRNSDETKEKEEKKERLQEIERIEKKKEKKKAKKKEAKARKEKEAKELREEYRKDKSLTSSIMERRVKNKATRKKSKRDGSAWGQVALIAGGLAAAAGAVLLLGKAAAAVLSWFL